MTSKDEFALWGACDDRCSCCVSGVVLWPVGPVLFELDRLFYLPNASYWTMRKLVARHQFGSDCSRLLVLHDDAVGAGLGWTLRMTVYLLALAMSQNRTLVEAPASNTSDHRRGWRWCTAEPGTLQCFFRPWTHCQPLKVP